MRQGFGRWWIVATAALAGGCGLLPDAYSDCDKPQPYQSAEQRPPLAAPAGAETPDTRNALVIPEPKAPGLPPEPGRCLEHPPSYGTPRPRGG
jgi:uncharacterized lipoprotein